MSARFAGLGGLGGAMGGGDDNGKSRPSLAAMKSPIRVLRGKTWAAAFFAGAFFAAAFFTAAFFAGAFFFAGALEALLESEDEARLGAFVFFAAFFAGFFDLLEVLRALVVFFDLAFGLVLVVAIKIR